MLVLEIVALRLVGPYVGVTLQVTSSVIGIALAAIAYGTWLGGRLADRFDPRALLAPALILGAIGTAVTLPLVRWGGEMLRGGAAPAVLLLAALASSCPPFCSPGSPRWWSSCSSATCAGPARWSAGCPASARWARSPPRWAPASSWSPRCRAAGSS